MRRLLPALVVPLCVITVAACRPAGRQFDLRGQILAVDADAGVVTIRHGDIQGFMPSMTMPFKVRDRQLLHGRVVGDLVTGTLFVTDTDAYLIRLDVTGHGQVLQVARPPVAEVLQPGAEVPDARLIDATGRPFDLSSLRGSVVTLTFVYTRCPLPQFCPLMDRQFAAVLARVRAEPRLRESVRMLSISFDPEYDTPAVLEAHGRRVGADGTIWRFATADRRTIDTMAPRFGVVVVRDDPNSITHNLRTAVIDRQGRLVTIYNGGDWTPDTLVTALLDTAR